MITRHDRISSAIAACVVGIQFLIIPFFASSNHAGKMLSFLLLLLGGGMVHFWNTRNGEIPKIFLLFIAIPIFLVFSSVWAKYPFESFLYLGILTSGTVFSLSICRLEKVGNNFLPKIVAALLVGGVFASALGFYEYVHYLWFGSTDYMLIPYLLPPDSGPRVVGTFGQANHFALFLGLVLLGFFYRYLHVPIVMPGIRWPFFLWIPPFLVALVFFLTGSRSGSLSVFFSIGILLVLAITGRYSGDKRQHKMIFSGLVLCLVLGFCVAKVAPGLVPTVDSLGHAKAAQEWRAEPGSAAGDERYVFWMSSLLIFADNPWLGVGLDHFKYHLSEYVGNAHDLLGFVTYESMGFSPWSHNEFLQILCEGGIFPFVIVLILVFVFALSVWRNLFNQPFKDPQVLYAHLFIVPFILQSMFSWSIRNSGLFILFFLFIGLLCGKIKGNEFYFSRNMRRTVSIFLFLGLAVTMRFVVQEVRVNELKNKMSKRIKVDETFPLFVELYGNPYSHYVTLDKALVGYLGRSFQDRDRGLAEKILPYMEEKSRDRGSSEDWYSLALLYQFIGLESKSRQAIELAIERRPSYDRAWDFLHYLNVLDAHRKSGRSVDQFFPHVTGGETAVLEYFYGRNRLPPGHQNL